MASNDGCGEADPVWTGGGAWYSNAPPGTFPPGASIESPLRGPDGPFLCDLRQGVDGRLQPAVVGHEPRARPPTLPAEPPAADDRRARRRDQGPGLHPLPAHPDEDR